MDHAFMASSILSDWTEAGPPSWPASDSDESMPSPPAPAKNSTKIQKLRTLLNHMKFSQTWKFVSTLSALSEMSLAKWLYTLLHIIPTLSLLATMFLVTASST